VKRRSPESKKSELDVSQKFARLDNDNDQDSSNKRAEPEVDVGAANAANAGKFYHGVNEGICLAPVMMIVIISNYLIITFGFPLMKI
jgi:hypothetical protein